MTSISSMVAAAALGDVSMKTVRLTTIAALAFALTACDAPDGSGDVASTETSGSVAVDLRVRDNDESTYASVEAFTIPASHEIGDGMMPYEGIGWENDLVGYRLYLDGRLVSDIFGKQTADPALAKIGEFGSYHDLAPWGMDVLKVGPSLGIGGLGIMRGDQPEQFGSVPELSAKIGATGGSDGSFTINAEGIAVPSGGTGGFTADYSIASASPLTRIAVKATGDLPLATGIVMHDGAELLQSDASENDSWRYVGTWGDQQSENKDGLGMALFYRAEQASYGGLANSTHFVSFSGVEFEYAFLAAWELDPQGIKSKEAFTALLDKELQALEGSTR